MKKIFAIAIVGLMVAFTSQANAFDNADNEVLIVNSGFDYAPVDAVVFEVVDFSSNFINTTVLTVSYASVEGVDEFVNIYSGDSDSNFATKLLLPNEVGLYTLTNKNTVNLDEPIPNLTNYVNRYNEKFGNNDPDIVKDIATNVGKLTKRRYIL